MAPLQQIRRLISLECLAVYKNNGKESLINHELAQYQSLFIAIQIGTTTPCNGHVIVQFGSLLIFRCDIYSDTLHMQIMINTC